LDEIFVPAFKVTTFDEVHPLIDCSTSDVPLKRQTAEVSSKATFTKDRSFWKVTRKDSAACVSLSSYSLVKQRETGTISYPLESQRVLKPATRRLSGAFSLCQ